MSETRTQKSVTIRDLAKACGFSPATVSRVLSNSDYPVRQQVREKILQTAEDMNYRVSRESHESKDHEVAILVPTIANPFYASMIEGFESAIVRENMNVVIYNTSTGFPRDGYDRIMKSLLSKRFQGIVISASNNNAMLDKGAKELIKHGVRVVLADCPQSDTRFNCISYNYEKGAFIGTQYLIERGHRQIVYAGLEIDRESRRLRILGFQRALEANGVPVRRDNILLDEFHNCEEGSQLDRGERLARQIMALDSHPTAVMAINDMVALGLLRGFQQSGLRVPEDISVIGFDDSPYSVMTSPPLTTVCVQSKQMGHMAAMLLLDDIHGTSNRPISLSLEPFIVERSTVRVIP